MKTIILIAICALTTGALHAQVTGIVYGMHVGGKKEPIYGAKIKLLNSGVRAITSEEGKFKLILPKELPDTMVVSARDFNSDTIVVDKKDRFLAFSITLYSDQMLPEIIISHKKGSHSYMRLKTLQVEHLGENEFKKAACCNLSEAFETNASVDVNITDAVSGAKKIQMMGLDGVYTQIQMENIPYLRGLESSFGLNSMPGTWIESIQITKGTGTVINGYESMAGLVNMELKKPETMEAVYLNAYVNAMARTELNFNSGFRLGKKWTTGWFAHGAIHPVEMDYNNDGFRDMPNGVNLSVFNRYQYEGEKMEAQFGFNAYYEDKLGGQMSRIDTNSNALYTVGIESKHIDAFAKTGFYLKKPYNSLGIVYNAKYHTIDANFGDRKFSGEETRGYVNLIYDGIIGTTDHKFKAGASGVYVDMKQHMDSLSSDRIEIVPGVFGEYTYTGSRISAVAGLRADYHNMFGFQIAPRLHLKYALTEYTDLRFTGGKGWRVPNYMIDNISLLATSQTWIAPDTLLPEISWNVGGSLIQRFKLFKREASLVVDFYHTQFENQMIVDRDANTQFIQFGNLEGRSFSNSLQTELAFSPTKTLDVRMAYKYLDVRATYGGIMQQQAMIPTHRGFISLGYKTRNKRWTFDATCSLFGASRLPQVMLPDGALSTDNQGEVYPILNAQATHKYKKWEFYVGGENLTNYRQENPIIDAQNPFSSSFNATRIWAPVFGVNVYAGLRFSIAQKEKEEEH